jgi:hypothetical protein
MTFDEGRVSGEAYLLHAFIRAARIRRQNDLSGGKVGP